MTIIFLCSTSAYPNESFAFCKMSHRSMRMSKRRTVARFGFFEPAFFVRALPKAFATQARIAKHTCEHIRANAAWLGALESLRSPNTRPFRATIKTTAKPFCATLLCDRPMRFSDVQSQSSPSRSVRTTPRNKRNGSKKQECAGQRAACDEPCGLNQSQVTDNRTTSNRNRSERADVNARLRHRSNKITSESVSAEVCAKLSARSMR